MPKSPLPENEKTIVQMLDFFDALKEIANGERVTRAEWESTDIYGFLDNGRLRLMLEDGLHEWIVTDGDMQSTDWYIV